jgi:hypothetical protein
MQVGIEVWMRPADQKKGPIAIRMSIVPISTPGGRQASMTRQRRREPAAVIRLAAVLLFVRYYDHSKQRAIGCASGS